jgi:hypothetical protein
MVQSFLAPLKRNLLGMTLEMGSKRDQDYKEIISFKNLSMAC